MSSVTKKYNPTLKTRNDLIGELTPMVWSSAPDDRPYGPFRIAPWLPVSWQDDESKDWFVLSTGKIVCLTVEGDVAPAGLRINWAAATGLTYTSDDFDQGTIDLTTGEAYAVDGTTAYTPTNIRDGLRSRGLIASGAAATAFLSYPVGGILYDVYAWAGGDGSNPAHLKFQNYQKQKGVQYSTRSQMYAPIVPAVHSSVNIPGALTGAALTFGGGTIHAASDVTSKERYSEVTSSDFVAMAVADYPIATDTDRTPIVGSSTDFLVTEKIIDLTAYDTNEEAIGAAVDTLTSAGDYFVDYEAGVVFMYASGGAAIPANVAGESFTYYSYAAAPAAVERYFCIVGDPNPGDWLKVDSNSNLQVWAVGDGDENRIARVHAIAQEPFDLLDRVQTSWSGTGMGVKQQMTGTASKGFSSKITYSDAADKLARIVLSIR